MRVLEYGKANPKTMLFLPCTAEPEWAFTASVTLLAQDYHVLQIVYDGHGETGEDFISVEHTVEEIIGWLHDHGIFSLDAAYGCSLGGACLTRFLAAGEVTVEQAIFDGGITPYQLPWIVTRFIALKDYLMMMIGRTGGVALLEKAFATDDYSKEDLQYVADVLRHCSRKTIWRTFDSCNNYKVPESVPKLSTQIHYWYAEGEEKERKLDINYMKRKFPQTKFEVLPKLGHAGLVLLKPELFAEMIDKLG